MPLTSEDLSEVWQGQLEASVQLGWWWFFYFGRRFSAGTWPSMVNERARLRGVGNGITGDRGLGRRSSPDLHNLTKNTSLGHKDRDFLQLDTGAAALGMQSYGRSFFCLLNVIFGCVSVDISIQFSTRFFPSRIECSVCETSLSRVEWKDRDTNDILAHCSFIFYFLYIEFSKFVCPFELHPLIWFFFFKIPSGIRKIAQNALAPSIIMFCQSFWNLVHSFYIPKRKRLGVQKI